MSLNIKADPRFREVVNAVPSKLVDKALATSINRTLRSAAVRVQRETAKQYNIRIGDLRQKRGKYNNKIFKTAKQGDTYGLVMWVGRTISLTRFDPVAIRVNSNGTKSTTRRGKEGKLTRAGKAKTGVSVIVDRPTRKRIAGGFMGKRKGQGKPLVWRRDSKESRKLKPLFGPSAPQMLDHEEVSDTFYDHVELELPKQFVSNMNHFLREAIGRQ